MRDEQQPLRRNLGARLFKLAARVHFPIGIVGLVVCGCIGAASVWNTLQRARELQDDHLPLFERTLKLKWLHYYILELATRSIERHDSFISRYASITSDMKTELEWMVEKANQINKEHWANTLASVGSLSALRIEDDQQAIDGAGCKQWGVFDCSVAVPGVASNVDLTITVADGHSACDAVDAQGGGICEWLPGRPDEVPEPQPPNLLNKCVCYACKGPLPDLSGGAAANFRLPPEYEGSQRGTDAKYQCLHDPRYTGKCEWDGLNCVPTPGSSLPDRTILNSSEYMSRFDSIMELLEVAEAGIYDQVKMTVMWQIRMVRIATVTTWFVAAFYTLLMIGYMMWESRPEQRLSLGFAFYTMTGLFLFMGWVFLVFMAFTSIHMQELWVGLRDSELELDKAAWKIVLDHAILTASASRFVMTAHNTGWIDEEYARVPGGVEVRVYDYWFRKYVDARGNLEASMAYTIEHTNSLEEEQIFVSIATVDKILRDLEQTALCSCTPPDASAPPANDTAMGVTAMYSVTYLQAQETYNQQKMKLLEVQMRRLSVRVRELQSKSELMLVMMATILVFIPISLVEISRQIGVRKALLQQEHDQNKQRFENVLSNTVEHLAHPLITIRCDEFLAMGSMIPHEMARKQGVLRYCESLEEARNLFIIFISHQWLHTDHPDPGRVHFGAIREAMGELSGIHYFDQSDMHIWLDYHSIPQYNGVSVGVGVSAIASLINYAMWSSVMLIIAPAATHEHGHVCNLSTYMSRGWCRAEQAGYMLKNGTTNLYIQDEHGFRRAATKCNYEAFFPMEGTFSCCRWNHEGGRMCDREHLVDVMLYLFYSVSTLFKCDEDDSFVYQFVMANKARIFPRTFLKTTASGTVSKVLFGNLLHELENMLKSGNLHPKRSISSSLGSDTWCPIVPGSRPVQEARSSSSAACTLSDKGSSVQSRSAAAGRSWREPDALFPLPRQTSSCRASTSSTAAGEALAKHDQEDSPTSKEAVDDMDTGPFETVSATPTHSNGPSGPPAASALCWAMAAAKGCCSEDAGLASWKASQTCKLISL